MRNFRDEKIHVVLALITQTIAWSVFNVSSSSNLITGLSSRSIYVTRFYNSTVYSLLSGLNQKADPCEDFYEYACGNWGNENPLPPGYDYWSIWEIKQREIKNHLKDILQRPITLNDIAAARKAKLSYRTCTDEDKIDERGMEGIEAILRRNLGWPLTMPKGTWGEGEFPWQLINNNYMTHAGVFGLFTVDVYPTFQPPEQYIILITKPVHLPFQRYQLAENNYVRMNGYRKYIKTIVSAMNDFKKVNNSTKRLRNEIRNMINFEIRLANITSLDDSTHDLMTIDELQAYYNSANPRGSTSRIKWVHVIRTIFADIPDIRIDGQERICVLNKQFFLELVKLLNKTPEEVVVNYIHWTLVDKAVEHTTRKIRLYHSQWSLKTYLSREKSCLLETGLGHAIAYAYMKEHPIDSAKKRARSLIKQIKKAMTNQIDRSRWFSNVTKILVKEKLHDMMALTGYPDWYTEEGVNNHYEDLKVGKVYFSNVLSRWRFECSEKRRLLSTSVARNKWFPGILPTVVDTRYSRSDNAIIIPASILQPPFFDAERPKVMDYGMIGALIGHEIAHGFDSRARQHDKYGNHNSFWDDGGIGQNKTQCLVDKFNNYKTYESSTETIYENGTKTLNENIADIIGFQLAYAAYEQKDRETVIDDITQTINETYSNDRLFFLSLANMWCNTRSNEYQRGHTSSEDVHSDSSLRVIGALSEMESFSKAFECPLGSAMNPIKKCGIWDLYGVEK